MHSSPLIHFVLAGVALFAARAIWNGPAEVRAIEVRRSEINLRIADFERRIERTSKEFEREAILDQIVEQALWLEQAWALGLHQSDPVVRQRLIQNMRFLEGSSGRSEAQLVDAAFSLKMERSDPVIRRRLVERVQALIEAGVRERRPDEESLRSFYATESDRWQTSRLLDFTHVYLSRDRRGSSARKDATNLLGRLMNEDASPAAGVALGDPFVSGHRLRDATAAQISARLGPAFRDRVAEAPLSRWMGPIESSFGVHLVWIHDRTESRLPDYPEVRGKVLSLWFNIETQRAIRAEADRQRKRASVRILEDATG